MIGRNDAWQHHHQIMPPDLQLTLDPLLDDLELLVDHIVTNKPLRCGNRQRATNKWLHAAPAVSKEKNCRSFCPKAPPVISVCFVLLMLF